MLAALSCVPMARADDKDVIEYREHIMNTLNEQAGALGEILSAAVPAGAIGRCLSGRAEARPNAWARRRKTWPDNDTPVRGVWN